ncbi:MAG: hypothetical protein U5L06_12610 [Rhodovibrio sp.]|nr:hypothetical protein [Rhodovibrio sp.]
MASASLAKSRTAVESLSGCVRVQAGERLHRLHVDQLAVDVHGVQQGLVEAGLVLVGDDQQTVRVLPEGLGGLALRDAVHTGFGEGGAVIGNLARKRNQRAERIALLGDEGVDGLFVADRVFARACRQRRPPLPRDLVDHVVGQMRDDDRGLLPDRVLTEFGELAQQGTAAFLRS